MAETGSGLGGGNRPSLESVDVERLVAADWNYKKPGTPEELARLAESIKEDRSLGVLPVRELKDGKLEVMDGNHRLEAIRQHLGWDSVHVENFGKISKARAVLIARRRNHAWFEDDMLALAELYRDEVFNEFTEDELDRFMPEGYVGMENIVKALDYDWKDDPVPTRDFLYDVLWSKWSSLCETMGVHDRSEQARLSILTAIRAKEPGYVPPTEDEARAMIVNQDKEDDPE